MFYFGPTEGVRHPPLTNGGVRHSLPQATPNVKVRSNNHNVVIAVVRSNYTHKFHIHCTALHCVMPLHGRAFGMVSLKSVKGSRNIVMLAEQDRESHSKSTTVQWI